LGPLRGQNNAQNPVALGAQDGWAIHTRNIVLRPELSVASKRKGSIARTDSPLGTYMLARHRPPNANEADVELWAFTQSPTYVLGIQRAIGSGAFVSVSFPPEIGRVTRAVTFNGKLFIAANTSNNRLYCWDGTQIRPVGILPGTVAPTASNSDSGAATAILRSYKINWMRTDPATSKITARSELTPAVEFTNAPGSGVIVTRPPVVPDASTHWRVWGSNDGGKTYLRLTETPIPIATTTYQDSADPTTYSGIAAPEVGTFLPPPSVTRIITDGNRLLLSTSHGAEVAGPGETTPKKNRLWYTPVLGSTDEGDDERIPQTSTQRNYIDLGENTLDGQINEIGGPINGVLYVAMQRRLWRLTPTGEITTPYLSYLVSDRYGATVGANWLGVRMINGEDHHGDPALYFLSEHGLYRITNRIEHVSFDVIDKLVEPIWWRDYQFLLSFPDQRQLWVVSAQADYGYLQPRIYVFHWEQGYPDENGDVRGGWVIWDIAIDPSVSYLYNSGCLHNRAPGVNEADKTEQVPYLLPNVPAAGGTTVDAKITIFDQALASDTGRRYRAAVTFAPWMPSEGQSSFRIGNPIVVAGTLTGVNLEVSATRDFGTETRRAQISLQAEAQEGQPSRVIREVEGLFQGDVTAVEFEIGDPVTPAVPTDQLWRVDWLTTLLSEQE
jgi:hypothetical protein